MGKKKHKKKNKLVRDTMIINLIITIINLISALINLFSPSK